MPRILLDLERPPSWPADLVTFLDERHDLFLAWETEPDQVFGHSFEEAIDGLQEILRGYEIVGWHCTRITDTEAENILRGGMELPNAEMLTSRIDALAKAELITPEVARRLKSENRADEKYRAGRVWFCFFPPRRVDEYGIGRFFQHWGGEALYVCHEPDLTTSPVLKRIGTPRLVEAEVPIALLPPIRYPWRTVYLRFLISRGYRTTKPTDHEGYILQPLPAENIRRIVSFPDPDFLSLTGCSEWGRYALDPIERRGGHEPPPRQT